MALNMLVILKIFKWFGHLRLRPVSFGADGPVTGHGQGLLTGNNKSGLHPKG